MTFAPLAIAALLAYASLVDDVRMSAARRDFAGAERAVRAYQAQNGATSELAAALSWLARGELDAGRYDEADAHAGEARRVAAGLPGAGQPDTDQRLATALGAAIEVHARVLAARGERTQAVAYLRRELATFGATGLAERIQKNINLLGLVGTPAPPLDETSWLGSRPASLAALGGHPVLLFFWAHWCPDCKAEAAVLTRIMRAYGPKGLVLIGPTKLYGYAAQGEAAAPAEETRYIEAIRRQFYSSLPDMAVPVSAASFQAYGASTTPTLVLLDGDGIVRFYHPGAVSEAELAGWIEALPKR
ncbi:MAG: thioredoxin fold domain-containing protein [Bryobacteraceae bacterium]